MQTKVLKIGKPFLLGVCQCSCNMDMPIRNSRGYISKYINGHSIYDPNNPRYTGGKGMTRAGYEWFYMPWHPNSMKSGRVYGHVLRMTIFLKRPLKKGEVVHHKNKIKNDNRIENLLLCVSQSIHRREHRSDYKDKICSNPDCKNPTDTEKDSEGRERWYGNKIVGYKCKRCYRKEKYHKNKNKNKK